MKKVFCHLIGILIVFGCVMTSVAASSDYNITERPDISIYVDGQLEAYSSPPVIYNGRTLLPLRELLVNLGVSNDDAHIQWSEVKQQVTIIFGTKTITLTVGSSTAIVNDSESLLDAAPINYKGRIFLPARFIAQNFGKDVVWDDSNKRICIGALPDSAVKQVIVSTAGEFVRELGSNKRILMRSGVYDLSSVPHVSQAEGGNLWNPVNDGDELKLSSIHNLAIEGTKDGVARIITNPRYANIFSFNSCSDITLRNIYAGHTPAEYDCEAGVLYFENCSNINIFNSELYGCGSIGIETLFTKNLNCVNTRIDHCSYKAIYLDRSESIHFSDCTFTENHAYSDIFYLTNSTDVLLSMCEISKNNSFCWSLIKAENGSDFTVADSNILNNTQPAGSQIEWGQACFFKTEDEYSTTAGRIIFKNTSIEGNRCDALMDEDNSNITFENCSIVNNIWGAIAK